MQKEKGNNMFNQFFDNSEYDECTSRGSCSISPSVAAVQEVILLIIRQSAFYIQKLKNLDINTAQDEIRLINMFSDSVNSNAYSEEELLSTIKVAYDKLDKIREFYTKKCVELNISKTDLPNRLYLKNDIKLFQIISLGEKIFKERYRLYTAERRNYIDLLTLIIKNTAKNLISILEYQPESEYSAELLICCLNLLNKPYVSLQRYQKSIEALINLNFSIFETLYNLYNEKFGGIEISPLKYSTRIGKAILVSGSNLSDLLNLLENTKTEDLDIYTHDSLVIAHAFSKFKQYKNLIGQFGNCQENCLLDFAVFPGAIFITKNSNINTEYMYRGRIFTSSNLVPKGVVQIKNNDYYALIDSANNAKGFAKGQTRPQDIIGFNESELEQEFSNLAEKIRNKTVKNVVIFDSYGENSLYYKSLVKMLPSSTYILSFSYQIPDRENFLKVNCGNSQILMWKVLNIFNKYISVYSDRINCLFSKCDSQTITNILYLLQKGFTEVYLTNCSPNTMNPALKSFIETQYGIREVTFPDKDFKHLI